MSVSLRTEITAYQLCVLDDSMGEGPHASVSRTALLSPRSQPSWWSASLRMNQNLALCENARAAGDSSFIVFYRKQHLISQMNRKRYRCSTQKRQRISALNAFVYRTGQHCLQDCSALDVNMESIESGPRLASSSSFSPSAVRALQLEYISAIFPEGSIITVPATASDLVPKSTSDTQSLAGSTSSSGQPLRCFTVVSRNFHRKKTVQTGNLKRWSGNKVPALVQNLRFWNPGPASSSRFEVFSEGHPQMLDLSSVAPWAVIVGEAKTWGSQYGSDTEACFILQNSSKISEKTWTLCSGANKSSLVCSALFVMSFS